MRDVISCITDEHNPWLVVLAGALCVSASLGAFFILSSRDSVSPRARRHWLLLAGLLAGGGTWATHFVAMLGYVPDMQVGFDLGPTIGSALACVLGMWAAIEVFDRFDDGRGRIVAGAMMGTAIAIMHYVGMAGLQVDGRMSWALQTVAGSWLFAIAFSIAALEAFAQAPARWRQGIAGGLLTLAIVTLHFTGMSALTLTPDPAVRLLPQAMNDHLLALTIATAAAAALLIAVVLALAERRVAATELAAAKQAAAMALHDPLTGLPNRRSLREAIPRLLRRHPRLAVVAVDLDRFKPVNDLYGHGVGDEVLVRIAKIITDEAGERGFGARLGGDEFVIIAPYQDEEHLVGWLSSLVARFDAPLILAEYEVTIGATLGVALAPSDGADAESLMRRADAALCRGKDQGKGRFAFFEAGMDKLAQERAQLERDLRVAVRNDGIAPHYQPLVDLKTGRITGYEILARWRHPTRGDIEPVHFIPVAEETGLIGELSLNLLRRACLDMVDHPDAPRLSLNISPAQLRDFALPQKIMAVLAAHGFPPARLEVELTEDALVGDFEAARVVLSSLKNIGVSTALDDFGTGYSSLRHLRELPFDTIKIDRSFVAGMNDSAEDNTIVRTIVLLAKNLGLHVTAEGVETLAQAAELQDLGCETAQGFLYGKAEAKAAPQPLQKASAA